MIECEMNPDISRQTHQHRRGLVCQPTLRVSFLGIDDEGDMEEEKLDYEEETQVEAMTTVTTGQNESPKTTKLLLSGLDMESTTVEQVREALKEAGFDGLTITNKPDMFEIECVANSDELLDKLNNETLLDTVIKIEKWDQSRKRSRTSSINSSSNVSQTPSESKKRVKTVDERITKATRVLV